MAAGERDPVEVAMAYASFLHDRLAICAPGFDAVRVSGASNDSLCFVVRRTDLTDGTFELTAHVSAGPVVAGRELVATAWRDGVAIGSVAYAATEDPGGSEAMERQLLLYLRAGAAALAHDLRGLSWPSDLPADLEAVSVHDTRAGAHPERVGGYAHIIVRALRGPLEMSDEFADAVFCYSPFHDIGQVLMGDEILRKPGRLDPDEWRLMQTHTTRGREIMDAAIEAEPDAWPMPDVLRNIVELHHESLDGSGYPEGRSGDDVPWEARIVSVADVFDALTSARPYKPGWSANEALEEMDRMILDGRLDPLCLTALVTHPDLVEAVAAEGSDGSAPIGHTR
jgi:HD-GYP domain-containing protein (c-di-GMP phosphodiesterase class II)